jgi:hypothetical protein
VNERDESFRYFLNAGSAGPPGWIRVLQWALLLGWCGFSWWILAGKGFQSLQAAYHGFHGVFAAETAVRVSVLPNWALVTLALGALCAWLQALWIRCGWTVRSEAGRWVWEGRRGPSRVERAVPTPGGCWVRDAAGGWFYIPRGLVNGEGREWVRSAAEGASQAFSPLAFVSPLLVLLLVLLAAAWTLQAPVRAYREARRMAVSAVGSADPAREERLLARHPEFRPWARYVATLWACDRATCLGEVIRDRLEVMSIGPSYGGDDATLARLLILSGRSALLLRLSGATSLVAFEVAVRNGDPGLARRIFDANPRVRRRKEAWLVALLLLQEGRAEESYEQAEPLRRGDTARGLALAGVLADLTGRCDQSGRAARALLRPESLVQARLEGPGSATGLGTLQRAARGVVERSSTAVGMELLGDGVAARRAWREAVELAEAAGLPGLIQVEAILLAGLDPNGPWASRRAAAPSPGSPPPSTRGIILSEVQR